MKRTGVPQRKDATSQVDVNGLSLNQSLFSVFKCYLFAFASFGVFTPSLSRVSIELAYIMPQEAMLKALSKLGGHEAGVP